MAHLLMIESFIGGNAVILPEVLKELGHTYTFLTRNRDIYNSGLRDEEHVVTRYAREVIEVNTNDHADILKTISTMKFEGVITTCDYYIDMVSDIAKVLKLPCPFPENVQNVRYKHKLRGILEASNLANPKYGLAYKWTEVAKEAKKIGYPLVLKPVDLASSAYVRLIQNEEELKNAFDNLEAFPINWRNQKRNPTYLLEEYMHGNEVSVEAITYNGETTIVGITQKTLMGAPYFIESGHMFPANLPTLLEKEIFSYVRKALKAAKYNHGVSHTEVKLTPEGPKIVEINPRCPGGHIVELIELVSNVNMLEHFVELSLGKMPTVKKIQTDINSACVRFLTPEKGGKITGIEGVEKLKNDPQIVSYKIDSCVGKIIGDPIDNAGRLGRIITKDCKGYEAMDYADKAMKHIKLTFERHQ